MKGEGTKVTPLKPGGAESGKRKRGTHGRLLDAGLKLFAQKGFDGTLISDLELEAGLKPGTGSFYRHFDSKEEVLREVIVRETESNHRRYETHEAIIRGSMGNTRAELILSFRMSLLLFEQMGDFIQILIREEDRLTHDARQLREIMIDGSWDRQASEMERRIQAGEVVDLDAHALTGIVNSALIGHFLTKRYFHVSAVAGVDDERFVMTLADLLTGARKS